MSESRRAKDGGYKRMIKTHGAVCPKCKQSIYCGLSYKGLYIKCPENHWPKIEEL
jgi:hypothetical protein